MKNKRGGEKKGRKGDKHRKTLTANVGLILQV